MREQLDKSRWELCNEVVRDVLYLKCRNLLSSFPFKVGKDGISPDLLK
jgi:hypothetical protein